MKWFARILLVYTFVSQERNYELLDSQTSHTTD